MTTPENPDRPRGLADLLGVWQAWNSHNVTHDAARRAETAGDTEQADKLRALSDGGPSAVAALAAQHELTLLLDGWRWHTVLAAREQGATWADIADATATSPGAGDAGQVRAEFLDRIEAAHEAEARFDIPFRDADRYSAAAPPDAQEPTMAAADDHQTVVAPDELPVPRRGLDELTAAELLVRAEQCDNTTYVGDLEQVDHAYAELAAIRDEAQQRADRSGSDVDAALASYAGLLHEDPGVEALEEFTALHTTLHRALGVDPASHDLVDSRDQATESTGEDRTGGEARGETMVSLHVDDLVTFDPATGDVRALTENEAAAVRALVPTDDLEAERAQAVQELDRSYWLDEIDATDPLSAIEHAAEAPSGVEPRPYDPTAEPGDPAWREPESQVEADARTAHLDALSAKNPSPPFVMRPLTEVEDALEDAAEKAVLADRAHDPDPEAWRDYHRLTALTDLAPLPAERPHPIEDAAVEAAFADYLHDQDTGPSIRDIAQTVPRLEPAEAHRRSDADESGAGELSAAGWARLNEHTRAVADPSKAEPSGFPDDLDRLLRRAEALRVRAAVEEADRAEDDARTDGGKSRRSQLTDWHHADTAATSDGPGDSGEEGSVDGSVGWDR